MLLSTENFLVVIFFIIPSCTQKGKHLRNLTDVQRHLFVQLGTNISKRSNITYYDIKL